MAEISNNRIRASRMNLKPPLGIEVGLGQRQMEGTVYLRFSRSVGHIFLTRSEATNMIESLTRYRDQILEK